MADPKNEGAIQQQTMARIAGMRECNMIILTEAVRLRETGLNHDSAIITSASTLIEAKIKKIQQAYQKVKGG